MLLNNGKLGWMIFRLVIVFIVAVTAFGFIFWLIGMLPESGVRSGGNPVQFLDNFYFSVVSVTTLGYGDLVPVGYAKMIAAIEAIFGLVYFGYAISQVVSFRQEILIDYLANSNVVQRYDECLAGVAEAKEMIGDRRRSLEAQLSINETEFIYFRSNPFYPLFRSVKTLVGYTSHVEAIGKAGEQSSRIELAAHQIEEAAGFARKLINILNLKGVQWKTDRSVMILAELCEMIISFQERFLSHTRYKTHPYKGGKLYTEVILRTVDDIRGKIAGPTIKYRKNTLQKSRLRRISRFGPRESKSAKGLAP